MKQRGQMIALEGVDGSGKSGASKFLAQALRDAGIDVLLTHEPGGTPEGASLRRILLAQNDLAWTPVAELLLMNASRRQHVERLVRPAIDAGRIVVCDRFVGSSLAYQGAGRGLSEELVLSLHKIAIDDFWPDLTIVLDLDPEIALARSRSRLDKTRTDEGRFESLDLDFHRRVRSSFLKQAKNKKQNYSVVDANQPIEQVQSNVASLVFNFINRKSK